MDRPYAILITILFITIGLHFYVMEAFTNTLELMKFVVNHPNRFHRPTMGFMAALFRCVIITTVAITNAVRIVALCNVLDIVIGYVSLVALVELDIYAFKSLTSDIPFKTIITASKGERPFMLTIDRTSSLKNNWADTEYKEGEEIDKKVLETEKKKLQDEKANAFPRGSIQ
jgi:hypothetical protein